MPRRKKGIDESISHTTIYRHLKHFKDEFIQKGQTLASSNDNFMASNEQDIYDTVNELNFNDQAVINEVEIGLNDQNTDIELNNLNNQNIEFIRDDEEPIRDDVEFNEEHLELNNQNINFNEENVDEEDVEFSEEICGSSLNNLLPLNHQNSRIPIAGQQLKLLTMIMQFQKKNKITNSSIQDLLEILKFYKENHQQLEIPSSVYKLNSNFNLNLNTIFKFFTNCCQTVMTFEKSDFKDKLCSNCSERVEKRNIIFCDNYFFKYSLITQLKHLLEKYNLIQEKFSDESIDSIFDSLNYKNFKATKPNEIIISLTLFCDGVNLKDETDIWPIMIRINNLDTDIKTRTFLNSCYKSKKTGKKPPIDFYFNPLIEELNFLSTEGLFLEKYNRKVYFYLSSCILDMPARQYFLCHRNFNSCFGCTFCLAKGKRIKVGNGTAHVYPYEKDLTLRTIELNEHILRNYQADKESNISAYGLFGQPAISKINNFNYITSVPPEPMHNLFLGIIKYNLNTSFSEESSNCLSFINKSRLDIINERIKNFPINSCFKRVPEILTPPLKNLKANQFFDLHIYILPIVFKSLINIRVYDHSMQLNYIITSLWNGGIKLSSIDFLKKIVNDYLNKVGQFYLERNYTANCHQLNHLVDSVLINGLLKEINAFEFESENGDINDLITNHYGKLEQIESKSRKYFYLQLLEDNLEENRTVEFFGKFFLNQKICFKKIKIGKKIYSSFENSDKKTKNCYVETKDKKFFCILYFFEENGNSLFLGQEIISLGNYKTEISLDNTIHNLEFDYLLHAKKTENRFIKNVCEIEETVLFVSDFIENSAEFDFNSDLGTIIKTIYPFHN